MIECARLSEQMPDVANGRSRWSVEELQHLTTCAECRAEWTVVAGAHALGDAVHGSLDAGRIADELLTRLKRRGAPPPWSRGRRLARPLGWMGAAAVAAAVLVLVVRPGPERNPSALAAAPTAYAIDVPELGYLNAGELEAVLEVVDEPVSDGVEPASLGDLDMDDLERVSRSLEETP